MYSGGNKTDGSIVGLVSNSNDIQYTDFEDIADTTAAEETLVGFDDKGQELSFYAQLDPSNGNVIWNANENSNNEEDLFPTHIKRTISMSQMTSMLRDNDRNRFYEKAISLMIEYYVNKHEEYPTVLDIGTGTGLLAMFCARHKASYVIGCEMFPAMAEIANRVIHENNYDDIIKIIPAKSTDIDISSLNESCNSKVDMIVSELLDSALLGESCIYSCYDAITRLLNDSSLVEIENHVIPHSAVVYGMAIQSSIINDMVDIKDISNNWTPYRDKYSYDCNGGWPPIPIHWNELKDYSNLNAKELSKPTEILSFNFFEVKPDINGSINEIKDIIIAQDGLVHGILTYWDLFLLSPTIDPLRECVYSTSPNASLNWQDHWLQVIYPLPQPLDCQVDDTIRLYVTYDSIRISIKAELLKNKPLKKIKSEEDNNSNELPICTCGWHMLCGAERLQILHDVANHINPWNKAINAITQHTLFSLDNIKDTFPIILDASDGSTISLSLGTKLNEELQSHNLVNRSKVQIISRELKQYSNMFHSQLVDANGNYVNNDNVELNIWDGIDWTDVIDDIDNSVHLSCIFSECFYYQLHSLPTWSALSYYYYIFSIKHMIDSNTLIVPNRAYIMIAPVELIDLKKGHGPVQSVNGFSHASYDNIINDDWYKHNYPYKLGNYRKRLLASPTCITSLDYNNIEENITSSVNMVIESSGRIDAIAIWVDYCLIQKNHLYKIDEDININYYQNNFPNYYNVLLRFFPYDYHVNNNEHMITATCEFIYGKSDFDFKFDIITS